MTPSLLTTAMVLAVCILCHVESSSGLERNTGPRENAEVAVPYLLPKLEILQYLRLVYRRP